MKIAIVADAHFKGKKLQDKRLAWEQAVRKMIDLDIHMLILAGDTFDQRNIGSRDASTGTVLEAFTTPLKMLTDRDIEVVAIKGNGVHEGIGGDTQASPLEIFKGTGITVADEPLLISTNLSDIDIANDKEDVFIGCMPWLESPDRNEKLEKFIRDVKGRHAAFKLIVGHLTVRGCTLNNGTVMQGGGEFEVAPEALEATGADLIVLGHIHKRQRIGERIWYAGALTQDSFGDEGNPQGFMLVDTDPVKKGHEHYRFIEIEAPKYATLTLKGVDVADEIPKGSEMVAQAQDYVKYRLIGKPDNYEELVALPRVTVEIVPERDVTTREVEGVEAGRSDEDLLRAWLKEKEYTPDDIERIVKEAREISEGAK